MRNLTVLACLLVFAPAYADALQPPNDVTAAEKATGVWSVTQTNKLNSCGDPPGERALRLWQLEGVRRIVTVKVTGETGFKSLEGSMATNKAELEGRAGLSTITYRVSFKGNSMTGEALVGYMGSGGRQCASLWKVSGKRQG